MRRRYIILIYGGLLVFGWFLGAPVMNAVSALVQTINPAQAEAMIWAVAGIYALASAIPFVPGAEVGLALLLAFGGRVAFLVYASTVAALTASFCVGRLVPAGVLCTLFRRLGLVRAADLVEQVNRAPAPERVQLLSRHTPRGVSGLVIRYRYFALALAFNNPGNTLLGGGGGIAMIAGMTRMFPLIWFVVTVMLAVAPVPLLVFVLGLYT